MNSKDVIKKNPRSTGFENELVYRKTSVEVNLEKEATELERCCELKIKTDHVFPVEKIEFDSLTNTLTTKKIVGSGLYQCLWNSTSLIGFIRGNRIQDKKFLLERTIEMGSWLRRYHNTTIVQTDAVHDPHWLRSSFEEKLNTSSRLGLISDDFKNRIFEKFIKPLDRSFEKDYLAENNIFICQIHGDFTIYNVLVDQHKNLHILDFGDTRFSTNIEDLARMYSILWAISETNRIRRHFIKPVLTEFLHSYGLSSDVVQSEFFKINLAYNFIIHLNAQHMMRGTLSWNSMRELEEITKAGIKWLNEEIKNL